MLFAQAMRRCVTLAGLTSRLFRCCRQYASTSTKALEAKATFQWAQLTNRALIRLSGADAGSFLQGLITNDMRYYCAIVSSSVIKNRL